MKQRNYSAGRLFKEEWRLVELRRDQLPEGRVKSRLSRIRLLLSRRGSLLLCESVFVVSYLRRVVNVQRPQNA